MIVVTEKIGTGHKINLYVVLPFMMPSTAPGLRATKCCSVFSLVFSSGLFPLVFTLFYLNSFYISIGISVAQLFLLPPT